MRLFIDLDQHAAVQDFTIAAPASPPQFKSQDTIDFLIYFLQAGVVQDMGAGFALKFGMVKTGDATNTILAYQTASTYLTDPNGNVYYQMQVNFNTSQMATAIGTNPSIACTIELRYQDALAEIIHTLNLAATVFQTIIAETGVTPPNVSTGYPDASTIELLVHKNAPSGYAGLSASSQINGSVIPVDGQTVALNGSGQLSSAAILAYTAANFTTPASGSSVSVTFVSTANLKATSYVRIPIAGYYIVNSITDSTHAVLQNNGDPFNAISGTTITSGAVVLPAQAAAGGGTAGQNAYTTLTAGFTVPAAGGTVSLTVASTAWMPGSGYALFIGGAGYYLVNSITDATHVVVTNSGSAANASPGTNVTSGATVTGAGPQGAPGAAGASLSAYDALTASFTQPAMNANVTITISNTAWLSANQIIYIASAGYFQVATVVNATTLNVTNLPYPGNASAGATIASGSKVSPAGLQGPQGAGGAGLNAFTTLSANFTQPATGATVTVNVGTTAWMAIGQGIFVQGGGYYTISSVADLTHAVVTNIGNPANVAQGSTVVGNGSQIVSPAGIPGTTGVDAYTNTTANFTTPASGASVTVTVKNTAWASLGQVLFVAGAGYYQVAAILTVSQFSLTNLGSSYGNAAGGVTISSGASVSAAGLIGPQGAAGPQGPAGAAGSGSTIYTGSSLQGNGNVATPATLVGDVAAGTNPYAIYQKDASGNNLWGPIPVDGTTIGIVSGKLTALGGGGGGAFDPASGLYYYDDFTIALTNDPHYVLNQSGGLTFNLGTYGQSNTALKIFGCGELSTGTTNGTNQGMGYYWGGTATPAAYPILYGLGALTWKTRIFLEGTLPTTGISYFFRAGIGQMSGTFYAYTNNPIQGFFFEYDPGQNSGQWRVAYATTASPTYTNTSVAVAGDTAYNLEIDANAAWTTLTFKINGTTVATLSSGFPTNVYGCPVWALGRGSGSAISYKAAIDSWMINYTFTR